MHESYVIHNRIKVKPADLIDPIIVVRVNEFKEQDAKIFAEQVDKAHRTGQTVIPVVIDSYGGECYSVLSMIGVIESSKIPVATIISGKAMSAGLILATFGTVGMRYIDPNAFTMLHEVSSVDWGKLHELKNRFSHTEYLNKFIFQKMANYCGHHANYFLELIKSNEHSDLFMNAEQTLSHKLVDIIKVPTITTQITANTVLS